MRKPDYMNPRPNEKDEFDVDIKACSTMDCTGLIPSKPQSKAEIESYEDLYPFITKAIHKND